MKLNQNKFDDCEILKKILPWDDKDTVWESRTFVRTPAIQKTQEEFQQQRNSTFVNLGFLSISYFPQL